VTCVEIRKNTKAKAVSWLVSDAEVRKLGERTGLDTPVVLAVNDDH
jgi:predicted xylose isomerase-like sugar epimerase